MTARRLAKKDLLERLLSSHERGKQFTGAGGVKRDVIVRVNAETFPDAYSADGRERLEALRCAIDDLAAAGAVRVVRHRGLEEPREVRMGEAEVATAYDLAAAEGFVPLARVLADLSKRVEGLIRPESCVWMAMFLNRVASGLANADTSPLGLSRERLKRDVRDIADALRAAAAIGDGLTGWERVVSERIFGDSKRLRALVGLVCGFLESADPRWVDGAPSWDDMLEVYGIRRRAGLLRCAGVAELRLHGRRYQVADFNPVAHLPESWGAALVAGLHGSAPKRITTIENETPFLMYVEEAGGPHELGERGEFVIYTAGFPSTALMATLAGISEACPDAALHHWGDADVGGLRIAVILMEAARRPFLPFRSDARWVETVSGRGSVLTDAERAALRRIESRLEAGGTELTPWLDLARAIRKTGVKIEQEAWSGMAL